MNLPDFRQHDGLNRLRQQIGASLIPWNSRGNWNTIDIDNLLRTSGLDISPDELEYPDDGTLEYDGRKVVVYIRDQNVDFQPYRFHVANCSTLLQMRRQNRYDRYVVATRTDGNFIVNSFERDTLIEENAEERLDVCINCLKRLDYNGYNRHQRPKQKEIKQAFDLHEFFDLYSSQIAITPRHTDTTAPLNIYPLDLEQISREYRESVGWECESCQVYLGDEDMQRFLHLHHVNGLRHENRNENLRALCIKCHAEEPQHQHLRNHPDYVEYLRILQNQGRHNF